MAEERRVQNLFYCVGKIVVCGFVGGENKQDRSEAQLEARFCGV